MKLTELLRDHPVRRRTWSLTTYLAVNHGHDEVYIHSVTHDPPRPWQASLRDLLADDWELYREPHDFAWATSQLEEGVAVARLTWPAGDFLEARADAVCAMRKYATKITRFTEWVPTLEDVTTHDWTKA